MNVHNGLSEQAPTLLAQFAGQVRRDPQALAVIDQQVRLTYAELASASERIAKGLQARGVQPGQSVALCMPRGWQWLAAILGALKIGAVVVPLDRASPVKRREVMLADAACVGLITLSEGDQWGLSPSRWHASVEALLDHPDQPPQPLAHGVAEVSFLFYTSGTTGTPKAVEVGERGLLRLTQADGYIEIRPTDRFACLSNPAFDACSFELWAPLLNGGCCVMIADEDVLDARKLARVLQETRIDNLFMTVALFNTLSADCPSCFASLRQVLIGGEQISAVAVHAWYRANPDSQCRIFNVYGPTECTTFALCWPIPRDFAGDRVPIGRPLPDTGVQVLDAQQRPVPKGEVGELYLTGSGVSRGYRNRPEETARSFVRLPPLDGGARVHYRTGDLVRQNADGLIECLGRVDRQVKIRGFRIEPGEVEQRILEHPQVAQVYVCTQRQAAEDHQLLAFIVPRERIDYREFDAHLRAQLAPYMRPHQLFLAERLPLTANGKIDRDALLAQSLTPWRAAETTDDVATSPALSWLLAQARSLLGQPALSAQDDWLGSGGDSLKAMRLRSAIRSHWQREITLGVLLGEPFAALAERLTGELRSADVYPPAPPIGRARRLPATAEQRRLWLMQQRTPTSTAYNVPLILHLAAGVEVAALAEAVRRLVARHPGLRTTFVAGVDGLDQVIAEQGTACRTFAPGHFTEDNWAAFAALVFGTPFDLATPTLFQAWLLPFADGSCRLLLNLHHIIVDGWSMNLLFDDLTNLYADALQGRASPEPTPRLTALEFGQWQRQWSVDPHYRDQRRALAELHRQQPAPSPALAPMRIASPEAGLYREPLGAVRSAALERFCSQQRLTRFEVLFSVFAWSLYALTGCERPRIASPVSNRPLAEFEDTLGMFANTVLIPSAVDNALALGEQLRKQTATVREVLALQDVALADLVEDLRLSSSTALFDFMFVLENTDYASLAGSGLRATLEFSEQLQAKCPLTLLVVGTGSQLECWWEYQCSHFDAAQMSTVNELFRRGLDLLLETPAATLDDLLKPYRLSLPPASEGSSGEAPFTTLADWFEHQVHCTPNSAALVAGDRRVTYGELNALADTLAATLIERHPLPTQADAPLHVVLFLEPSVEHIVALLALAKLNLTAVPLDPAYPLAVQRQVLEQAQPHCLLFGTATEAALAHLNADRFALHRVDLSAPAQPYQRPGHAGERALYTLFTSGSTGTPKGVQVPDRTLCNLLQWQRTDGQLPAKSVTLQFSMLSFDVSFQEVFGTLCGGGCYHLITPRWRQDAEALLAYLIEARIERLFLPCVALQHLAHTAVTLGIYPQALRDVVTAGEQLLCTDALRTWFSGLPQATLFNHYGPTETHVVSAWRLPAPASDWPLRAPIGHAVSNARLLLVDELDRPVPKGCRGYLLVAGPMIAECYLADPALNAARFVELPQADGRSRLFYRTGDLAWADPQGCLHYVGRDDQQIKLSGHRLELGQIEATLMQVPDVVNAVVTIQAEPPSLTAYLQLDGTTANPELLDREVARQLPAHVRIDEYRRIDSWPRTPSGKIDRKALNGLGAVLERQRAARPVVALSALERQLSELFSAVIGREIEPDQTFFEAGATSLGLMRLHARYNQELPHKVAMADLFEQVTVRRLAAHLSTATAPAAPVERVRSANAGQQPMAIVGMSVNVAGAQNLAEFWDRVQGNELGIERFTATEGLVGARSQLTGMLDFDPEYFGISRQEARLMDPQQRHLLMACVQALQHAAITPSAEGPRIGLVASCGETTYFQQMLRETAEGDLPDGFQMALHHDKDFLATKAAYHLDLTGPAMSVQAACGSSLIAVHLASAMLRQGDSDVMLAAGVLIDPTLTEGYRHRSQHIFSRDGLCRPFSDDASGTIGASGYGVVVLKPLAQAQADGDRIYALVEASALNNDGRDKMSYTAPSVAGQSAVIREALGKAGLTGADIGYIEAHGTGTLLGDPIEVAALTKAFGDAPAGNCALASVKSQIGHLGAAAGVVGLIRATLAVFHGVVPPNLGFGRINPQIDLAHSPFYVPTTSRPWPTGHRRVAGVSSFGIGGTNAHVIVGEAPPVQLVDEETLPLLMISAHSRSALLRDVAAIGVWLKAFPERQAALLRYLQSGRRQLRWRFAKVYQAGDEVSAQPSSIKEVTDAGVYLSGHGHAPLVLLEAWHEGVTINWPQRSAPPPWDLPPSSFDLEAYRFQTSAVVEPEAQVAVDVERQPLVGWFHQRQWVRTRRLSTTTPSAQREMLVMCSNDVPDATMLECLGGVYQRVIQVRAGNGFKRLGPDRFELDPLDAQALTRLFGEVADSALVELDWLHALPMSVTGTVNEQSLAAAQWACLDTVSALMQAWGQPGRATSLRLWLMSWQACPVDGEVMRPELAALAGVTEVLPQEYPVRCHWLDWPAPQCKAQELAALLSDPASLPRRMAIRGEYLWQPRLIASPLPEPAAASNLLPVEGTFLVLGGTGGIGRTLCEHLLQAPRRRVVMLSRRGDLPVALAAYSARIECIQADIADLARWPTVLEQLTRRYGRFAGVIHAAGVGAGSLIRHRDARQMDEAMAVKTRGMLAVEALIEQMAPGFVLYCSSMSALFGGAGHLDYAAASGVLDGFAHYRAHAPRACVRLGINWDIWRDIGMATAAGVGDAAHQAHLTVGLSAQEGCRVFDLAMAAQLPQLLISTTGIDTARRFYPVRHGVGMAQVEVPATLDLPERLRECLCKWLGVNTLDDDDSLYELGADSLTLLDLIDELQAATGVVFQLSQFSHKVSLREVLALAQTARVGVTAASQGRWVNAVQIDQWHAGVGREWLYLIHPVGGDVQAYRELVSALHPDLGVCVIADPALRLPDLLNISLVERAQLYLHAIQAQLPEGAAWRLAGWSFGAWVAQAMCSLVQASGFKQPLLYLIDPPAPDAGAELACIDDQAIEHVFQREFALRWPDAAAQAMSGDRQAYLQRLTRCCHNNIESMSDFQPPALSTTPVRMFIAGHANPYGLGSAWGMDDLQRCWQRLAPRMLGWHLLDTDHYGIVAGHWARMIAEMISADSLTGKGGRHES